MRTLKNVKPDELCGPHELGAKAGVAPITVHKWRERYDDFPEPFVELSRGPIWYWPDVREWLENSQGSVGPRPGKKLK